MSRDSVAVRIAGHEYKIRSDGDADALREIAGYVDRAMARVRERTGTVDSLDVAVLTCLNLAREILALHEERSTSSAGSGFAGISDDRLRELIDRVEAAAGGAAVTDLEDGSSAEELPAIESAESGGDGAETQQGARTLELPSVESLRERSQSGAFDTFDTFAAEEAHDSTEADDAVEAPRVAAGGRDRAS